MGESLANKPLTRHMGGVRHGGANAERHGRRLKRLAQLE